jgi:Ca2+-binding RTX toxin-like protein
MADSSSVLGGVDVPYDQVPNNVDAYYTLETPDTFFDLSDRTAASEVDATGIAGSTQIDLGSGNDTVGLGDGDDRVFLGDGADIIDSRGGNDSISGGVGDDSISLGAGNDSGYGAVGADRIDGGEGNNLLNGGDGDDVLWAGSGADKLIGGNGDDFLNGYAGNDFLMGGTGSDTLIGGEGSDMLMGGVGSDVFFFDTNFGNDVITDLAAGDQIHIKAGLNDLPINSVADIAGLVTGDANGTTITIGENTIRIEGMDKDAFLAQISDWVKIV